MTLTAERLREILSYDPETGWFRWLVQLSYRGRVGKIAGSCTQGHWVIGINNTRYYAHRLAWLYMTGKFPDQNIDHIDQDGTHNAWSNLREGPPPQNGANSKRRQNNTSGFKGVSRFRSRWIAKIAPNRHQIYLGTFDTPEEAHAAYLAAAQKHFGEFANGGRTA